MQPLISIIIPIFNVQEYIEKCFDSIQEQDMQNEVEIICIDDGSSDKSGIICDKYSKMYKNFKVIHQKNKGVSSARNLGVKISNGKYLAWIDPDDYIDKNWYKKIRPLLEKDIDIIFYDFFEIKNGKKKIKKYLSESKFIDKDVFLNEITLDQRIYNQLWQKVLKKTLMNNIVFPENVTFMEDYAVLDKIALNAKSIYYISTPLYFYRIREKSLTKFNSIKKTVNAYLMAEERYKYLLSKKKNISKLGYLIQALNVCIQYNKIKQEEQIKNKEIYNKCKIEINKNIWYIFISNECSLSIKLKFLLCKMGLLKLALYLKKIIIRRDL